MTEYDKATYPQFTNLKLNEGLFDQLMATVEFHVKREFDQQRISSADYAKVYLGSLEAVLANSTQYLLGIVLLEQQKLKLEAEIALIELEGEKLRYEIDYVYPLKVAQLELENQKLAIDVEKLRFEIDYLYPAQLIKLQQEGLLIEAQVRLADANVLKTNAEVDKIEAEILMLESQKLLIDAQIDKIVQEILFLQAKIKTEEANTSKNFSTDSLIGRQAALLQAQKLGFAGDLYIKQAKLHADYAAVWQSVQETTNTPTLVGDAMGTAASTVAGNIAAIS